MFRSLPFGRTVVTLLSLGFLALFGIAGVSLWLSSRIADDAARVGVSDLVRGQALQVYIAVREAEAGQRGYLITSEISYLRPYQLGRVSGPAALGRLQRLTALDARQQETIAEIRPLLTQKIALMQRTVDLARAGERTEAAEIIATGEGQRLTMRISDLLGVMIRRETEALNASQARSKRLSQLLSLANLVAAVLIGGLAVVSVVLVGQSLKELRSTSRELRRVNEGLEAEVEERTAEIRRANEEIQRFAYIVSHDLRSPLVNVMGFTSELEGVGRAFQRQLDAIRARSPELLDPEAAEAAEQDLPESLSFIRSSTAKMDRLIAAILRLSRDGRRVLTPAPVDMTALARQVADSLRMVAEEAGAEIVVEPLPDVTTDRLALEQILSNLVENAVKYLQPGRPGRVIIRGRKRGYHVEYQVEDNGRGIAPNDHQRVFELFRRAGAQDKPGEGLGLAFVQTNVRRLGGTIQLSSTPGEGSTFTLTFPHVLKTGEPAVLKEAA
jgi:signal transduction histidine kinase